MIYFIKCLGIVKLDNIMINFIVLLEIFKNALHVVKKLCKAAPTKPESETMLCIGNNVVALQVVDEV